MPTTQHHIIRQQFLHVEVFGTESGGLALQRRLPELCRQVLLPALERTLDRAAPTRGHLAIERLEVDAGILNLVTLERDLAEAVTQAIEKQLRGLMQSAESPQNIHPANIRQQTEQQSIHGAFVFFLNTGSLPWWFHLAGGLSLEPVILRAWQEGIQASDALPHFNADLLNAMGSATARKRLATQFSAEFLENLLARLSTQSLAAIHAVFQRLETSALAPDIRKHFARQLWQAAFAGLVAGKTPSALAGPATGKTQTALALATESWNAMLPLERQQPGLREWLERHWPGATNGVDAHGKGGVGTSSPPPSLAGKKNALLVRDQAHPSATGRTEEDDQPARPVILQESGRIDLTEGVYVDCAGLVLLHPFLPRFFEALGIATDGQILRPERALCLLHYLATGQDIAPEYALILPKLLCNVPLEAPAESAVGLTAAETEEATALLKAVIGHWDALRDTSPDGLRGIFLARPGKLSERNGGDYLLQVETQSFDILLDSLPWGFGIIKLPWMKNMLWVEWEH